MKPVDWYSIYTCADHVATNNSGDHSFQPPPPPSPRHLYLTWVDIYICDAFFLVCSVRSWYLGTDTSTVSWIQRSTLSCTITCYDPAWSVLVTVPQNISSCTGEYAATCIRISNYCRVPYHVFAGQNHHTYIQPRRSHISTGEIDLEPVFRMVVPGWNIK